MCHIGNAVVCTVSTCAFVLKQNYHKIGLLIFHTELKVVFTPFTQCVLLLCVLPSVNNIIIGTTLIGVSRREI